MKDEAEKAGVEVLMGYNKVRMFVKFLNAIRGILFEKKMAEETSHSSK